jgi:signal transduction histidine kinase
MTVIGIGIIVIIGWIFDIHVLKNISSSFVTMKLSTAISFVMSGVIIYLMNEIKAKNSSVAKVYLPAPIIVIIFFMITLLVSNLAGIRTGIEDIFISETEAVKSLTPGRPSVGTMVSFILVIIASLLFTMDQQRNKLFFIVGDVIIAISGLSLIGYATDLSFLYYEIENVSTAMALHTSITFILVGISMILLSQIKFIQCSNKRMSLREKTAIIVFTGTLPVVFLTVGLEYAENQQIILGIPSIIAIIAFATIATMFISKLIILPIKHLDNDAAEVSKGNLSLQLDVVDNDEIGDLTTRFELMKEKIKARTLELEELNKDLQTKNKQKDEFSSVIAHELKTPLVPIKGYLDMMLAGKLGQLTERQIEKLEIMRSSVESLNKLINDLTDVQKIEMNVMKLHMSETHLSDLINESVIRLRTDFDKRNIRLKLELQNVTCICDKDRMMQVVFNLLTNAIDFCPVTDGKISIELSQDAQYAKIIVTDNGIGISKEHVDKIFNKFYQVDSSLTREHGGTGLGLAIVQGIVQEHGGKVSVDSKIGHGTTFTILLPKNQEQTSNAKKTDYVFKTN